MRRILHVSDLHFGPRHMPEVAAGVARLVDRAQPDLVVNSGDMTQRAKPLQFSQALEFLGRLAAPTLSVPGNHDVPMYRVWERVGVPFGVYRQHFASNLEPDFFDSELAVVGLNSAFNWTVKDGRLKPAQLRSASARWGAAEDGAIRIAVVHHQLVPPPRFENQRVLSGAFEAQRVFAEAGVEIVLSGHLHQAWVGTNEAYYPSGQRPMLLVHSGTTTSSRGRGIERRRNTCNWIEIDATQLRVQRLIWQAEESRFVVWSEHRYPRRTAPNYWLGAGSAGAAV